MNKEEQRAMRLFLCSLSKVLQGFLLYEPMLFEATIFLQRLFSPFENTLLSKLNNVVSHLFQGFCERHAWLIVYYQTEFIRRTSTSNQSVLKLDHYASAFSTVLHNLKTSLFPCHFLKSLKQLKLKKKSSCCKLNTESSQGIFTVHISLQSYFWLTRRDFFY